MTATSSGLVMYNLEKGLKVFLAHPGGPFWKNKDIGAWSIPKGETDGNENLLETAKREFFEVDTAMKKINPVQAEFIKRLIEKLNYKFDKNKQAKLF